MADKFLNEAEWQKFSKGRDFKEAPLLKALAAFSKVKQPTDMPAVLDEVEKQADVLRKAGKGDKELIAFLDGLDKSLEKERKLTAAAIKEAEKESESEEEEESPTLLTTKMIPLLRQVKKGEEMQVMVANTGKDVAVLISRRSISPTKRKMLTEYLGASGGVKFILGHCIFEENAYTFVVQSQAAGLAKKVKAALLKQVELRLKVRVRGDSPDDIDDDGEPAEENEALEAEGEEPKAGTQAEAPAAPPVAGPDPLKGEYDKRLAAVTPNVMAALKAQGPDAAKVRALIEFVREKGGAGNFKAAVAALDSLEKLLSASGAPTTTGATTSAAAGDAGPAFNVRLAGLMGQVKAAIAAGGGDSVKLKVAEAGGLAAKKEFERANAALDEVEQLLKSAAEGVESEGQEDEEGEEAPSPAELEWQRALMALDERYNALLKRKPADASALRAVMDHSHGKAELKDYALATAALTKLAELMDKSEQALDAGGGAGDSGEEGYEGIVEYRTALLAFRTAVKSVEARIADLKKAIPSQLPDEADLAEEVASALAEFNAELLEAVDAAMNRSENKASPVTRAVAASINGYLVEIASNPLIKHVDANVFGVNTNIEDTLTEALTDIRDAMPALR
ncbi:MAG TPA: hypothetical protein VGM81_00995 [Burkholderiaceae bacterium]|jgi:hypothetical protein